MNALRVSIAMIGFAAGTTLYAAETAPTLNDAWYRVEVVIFERVAGGADANTQEILLTRAPRVFPRGVVAFDNDESRADAYPLDAETRAEPALPIVVAAAIQRTPTRPSGSADPAANATSTPPPADLTPAGRAAKAVADYEAQLQQRSYQFEPASSLLLSQEEGRLRRSNLYKVLFHRAWLQPVPDRDQLLPMLIQLGDRVGTSRRIEGFLGVTRGRYLHLDARLWYTPDPSIDADGRAVDGGGTAPYMELREQRRMRSGELHYLDHPRFGLLARVDPVSPPEALVSGLAHVSAPSAPANAPIQSAAQPQ